jgi:thioredoxin 1
MDKREKYFFVDNKQSFHDLLKTKDRVVALFYVSWCPFCRKFLPVFERYARQGNLDFVCLQDDRENVGDEFSVDIFPTVLFFAKGRIIKRLDGEPGVGLSEKQLADFINDTRTL